jgi:hypothetical protein
MTRLQCGSERITEERDSVPDEVLMYGRGSLNVRGYDDCVLS